MAIQMRNHVCKDGKCESDGNTIFKNNKYKMLLLCCLTTRGNADEWQSIRRIIIPCLKHIELVLPTRGWECALFATAASNNILA
jgi:hypothetical protein